MAAIIIAPVHTPAKTVATGILVFFLSEDPVIYGVMS